MIKNKTARNKFQGGELTTVRTQSALFVIPLKICLYRQLPLRGVAVVLKEPLHSAPGLPDAGLILKKLPPVGRRKINQFFRERKTRKSLARRNRGGRETADPPAFSPAGSMTESAPPGRRRNLHVQKKA